MIIREDKLDHSATACASKAHRIADTFRSLAPEEWFAEGQDTFDMDLCDIVENLETMNSHQYPGECGDFQIDELNQLLARIFDWADGANVFLGV